MLVYSIRNISAKVVTTKRVRLGRPGTSLKMGFLGMANIGKSSTFNLLSNLNVPAENIPFCTIEPNTAYININDKRFKALCKMYMPKKQNGPILRIVDIAGLVKGASEGYGLGNEFLSHVMQVDGLYHVVRAFQGQDIAHTEGGMDPVRDIKIIREQLIQKDIQIASKKVKEMTGKASRTQDANLKKEFQIIKKVQDMLKQKQEIRNYKWQNPEIQILNKYLFLTSKPMIYLLNMSESDYLAQKLKNEDQIIEEITESGRFQTKMIKYSVEYEQNQEKEESKSQIDSIIRAGYDQLQILHYYTVGTDEVRAWTIRVGDTAMQAGAKIHTDFMKGFISAEVIHADTLISNPQYKQNLPKNSKKQGKTYKVKEGDIIHFNTKFK